ncbi:molybdopterin-binding domain-containing protein [Derxia lacustris]|uniref:hypothetical protein n=1 Tax=Derxia lacustris TaxID=764842 RepID=UPI000A17815A|nr:hypothetical protein [Derxia lacustris]
MTKNAIDSASDRAARDWTCPFCSLLCDGLALAPADAAWTLEGSDCPRALAALRHFAPAAKPCTPACLIDGQPASLDAAIAAAAERLARWKLPLYGGLATDVAGARALYRLLNRSGGVADHANGEALATGLRALQDRGAFYTTLAEIKAHADLIVCLGTRPDDHYPEFFARCGADAPGAFVETREVVAVALPAEQGSAPIAARGASIVPVATGADLHATVAALTALCAGRKLARPADPALAALAERLRAARYAVLVWEPGSVARHGSLVAEAVLQCVATLNAKGRAAAFALGGSEGGYTVQQAFTWMSGLPLRTALRAGRLDHDPLRHGGNRLLADDAVDGVLWVSSFGPTPALPGAAAAPAVIDTRATEPPDPVPPLPAIVLGHPAQAGALADRSDCVFIPVATPGIGAPGHLFRTEGSVLIPLAAIDADGLPTVADVAARIAAAFPQTTGAAA